MTSDSTSGIIRRITSFVADTNVRQLGECGQNCRAFKADNDGNVAFVDESGETIVMPVLKGDREPVRAATILKSSSGTSVTGLTLYF